MTSASTSRSPGNLFHLQRVRSRARVRIAMMPPLLREHFYFNRLFWP
jgi:hypothetical protein